MKKNILIFLILFGLALYLPFLGKKEFQGEEGRRVLIALEMLEKNEYLYPQLFEEPYFNKPPLFNWVLAFFFKLINDYSEFSARALSSLSILIACIFLTLLWGEIIRSLERKKPPSLTIYMIPGLIFLTTPEVIDKALRAEIDAFYTMLITFALFGWFYFYEIKLKKNIAFLFCGIFLGLGILTKTFQALIFFYLPYLAYLLIQKRWKEIFTFSHLIGIFTIIIIFLAWTIPVSTKVGIEPFIKAWLEEYKSVALAKEMTPLQHLKSFTLFALLGFSPWIYFLLLYRKSDFRHFLKMQPTLNKLWVYSGLCFGLSYIFHFFFFGARFRYILPSVGGFVFLSSLSIYFLLKSAHFSKKLNFFLAKVLPFLSLVIGTGFFFYSFKNYSQISSYFYLFCLLFIILNVFIILRKSFSSYSFFWYLIIYVFLIKQLYVTFYYSFHQIEMNHFRKAAFKIAEITKNKKELYLCKTMPHHVIYYLRYRFKLIDKISYLNDCDNLPENSFILFHVKDYVKDYGGIKNKNLKVISLDIRGKPYYLIYTGKF